MDFSHIRSSVSDTARCHGPISQQVFLASMGIGTRVSELIKIKRGEEKERIKGEYTRLVNGMGAYQVLAMTCKSLKDQVYPFHDLGPHGKQTQ